MPCKQGQIRAEIGITRDQASRAGSGSVWRGADRCAWALREWVRWVRASVDYGGVVLSRGKGAAMAGVHDVAAAILDRHGEMTAMKLQKLVYYSQAWHLVWEERELFPDPIEAWANGPVVRALYESHRRIFRVAPGQIPGDPKELEPSEVETVELVLGHYGEMSAASLSELTHSEPPWADARNGLSPGERGNRIITSQAMYEYYDSLI